ncbi:DUF1501 domain-containing protein [Duganella aceris]|uniref:DUF1501 domain-containing protein n=1 Tax=Duganella aceris TaxID=2703883 RepID=A0ABX0FJH5_9BURK|nr:DUF1501 domain-containing protein [Duganella aceris]NGZ84703.1 DUF1501 domain-containing protein [Duganella aceris]
MTTPNTSRRRFLGQMLAATGSSALPFTLNLAAMSTAAAATATDYKALVCLFMNGGNDGHNTVLATDSTSWNDYVRLRTTTDSGSIVLPGPSAAGGVLSIKPLTAQAGRTFALHPSMGPLKQLFDGGSAAILANVGTLVQPTTKAQYAAGTTTLPSKLFSHNDQTSAWQAYQPEGAAYGWGGRMLDILASANSAPTFASISTSGRPIFLSGKAIRQYQLLAAGAVPVRASTGMLYHAQNMSNPLLSVAAASSNSVFEKTYTDALNRAVAAQGTLSGVMLAAGAGGIPDPTPYVNPLTKASGVNPLAVQLQTVARVIGARNALGLKRQVFYVSMGGFDTHDDQISLQADLLARLAHAIDYFNGVMTSLQGTDLRKQVTLFTASDFGRTFSSNGDGTDHGWGSHHFVVGGAVKGGNIYGAFPTTGLGHELDVGSGALLPTTSVDQYGATLASWFGLTATEIADVFPNIGNFSTRNLGFMTA